MFGDFKDLEPSNSKEVVDSGCEQSEDNSDAESVSSEDEPYIRKEKEVCLVKFIQTKQFYHL